MTQFVLALTVGCLFACGTYLLLRRGQIKLILGLGLLSYGVNLLLFGSGELSREKPPVFPDKYNYLADLAQGGMADPLPQALILTAIVISFGITAFIIALINRRHTIAHTDVVHGEQAALLQEGDPFREGNDDSDDFDWLPYEVDDADYDDRQIDSSSSYQREESGRNEPRSSGRTGGHSPSRSGAIVGTPSLASQENSAWMPYWMSGIALFADLGVSLLLAQYRHWAVLGLSCRPDGGPFWHHTHGRRSDRHSAGVDRDYLPGRIPLFHSHPGHSSRTNGLLPALSLLLMGVNGAFLAGDLSTSTCSLKCCSWQVLSSSLWAASQPRSTAASAM